MNPKLILLLMLFVLIGCVEDFDLYRNKTQPLLVVDGVITDAPGPYYVQLTLSKNESFFLSVDYKDTINADPVLNALVIISDNLGVVDTLRPIDYDFDEYIKHPNLGYVKLIKNSAGIVEDTIFLPSDYLYEKPQGFYKTTHIRGLAGNNYFLKIVTEGKEYQATCFMPPVPKVDSIGFQELVSDKDGWINRVPLIFFKEPQDVQNYYLFDHTNGYFDRNSFAVWRYSILSDTYLDPYVNGLKIDLGASVDSYQITDLPSVGEEYVFKMASLTRESYEYYKALIDQFKYDGGAYKPTPATPPSNISNGALGFFRASAVTTKVTIVK